MEYDPPVMPTRGNSNGMKVAELGHFRKMLVSRLEFLAGNVNSMASLAFEKSPQEAAGDLSKVPVDMADVSTESYEREVTLGLIQNQEDEIRELEAALERVADKTFGLCEGCKKRIPRPRLEAVPYARHCVECQREEEGLA